MYAQTGLTAPEPRLRSLVLEPSRQLYRIT